MNVKVMDEGGPGDGSHPLGFTSFTENPGKKYGTRKKTPFNRYFLKLR